MPYWYQRPTEGTAGRRRFAIVSAAEPERVFEIFEAMGWAQAVLRYANNLQTGIFTEPVTLREAKESDELSSGEQDANQRAEAKNPES